MKKMILIFLAGLMIFSVYNKSKKNEEVKLPDSAIRFRVLANSNSPRDQKIKEEVRDKMQKELYTLLENAKSAKQARNLITSNMDNFNDILAEEMKDKEYSYTIDYGMHPFPEKKYKGITYEAGEYESLLVTLGSGEGDNWWCVLFPPLCLLEAEETTNTSDIEYKSFIKEIIENELPRNVELVIKNTICSSTEQRQIETKELSKKVDMMIIVGGKNSSNTKKLYEVSLENCPKAVCIESYEELENMQDEIKNARKIGVMAGASTPQKSIEEVIKYLI